MWFSPCVYAVLNTFNSNFCWNENLPSNFESDSLPPYWQMQWLNKGLGLFLCWGFILIKQTSPAKWNVPCQNLSLNQRLCRLRTSIFFYLLSCYIRGNGNLAGLLPRQSSWAPEPDSAVKYSGWILGQARKKENFAWIELGYVIFFSKYLNYPNFDFIYIQKSFTFIDVHRIKNPKPDISIYFPLL